MKLYDAKTAPNPRLVRVFLAEKGIEVPLEPVDIMAARNREPEFRKRNPFGTVPVLELDDGTCISETVAICRYFEALKPEPALMGAGSPREQALVEMWRRRVENELFHPVGQTFRNTHEFFKGRIPQSREYGEICRRWATARLGWLDGVLAQTPYVAGDAYSIADITALIAVDFGRVSGIRPGDEHPNLKRWHAEVSARPSAAA